VKKRREGKAPAIKSTESEEKKKKGWALVGSIHVRGSRGELELLRERRGGERKRGEGTNLEKKS